MHECSAFTQAVSDYLDGALDAACRVAIDDHLQRCRRCRVLCDTTRRTVELYRTLPAEALPAEVESRLMAALQLRIGCK
jgi:RNA polymerase sigma-70 factor (ECF subfamily)